MKQELEQNLFKRHACLMANRSDKSLVFECSDGWYQLLDDLFSELEEAYKKVEYGRISQVGYVKEKFGTLDVGIRYSRSSEIGKIVIKYEKLSVQICEGCGKPSKLRWIGGWATTRCDDCVKVAQKRKEELRRN